MDYGYGYILYISGYRGMAFNLNYTKSGSVSEFYFFFTIVAARNLWR